MSASDTGRGPVEPYPAPPRPPVLRRAGRPGAGPTGVWGAPAAAPPDAPGQRESGMREASLRDAGVRPPRRPAAEHVAEAPPAAGGRRVRVRVVERFPGQRVKHRTGPLRRIRSLVALLITAVLIAAVLAAALSATVWGISVAIHGATTS